MATEAPLLLPHLFPSSFTTPPSRHHLAELRIEPAHSAVAFSAPCGKKRRCLLPLSSPRKKVLLELHPFGSPPPSSPTPPPPRGSPATAPPSLSSRAAAASSPATDFSFPLAGGGSGGGCGGGGNMFAFLEDAAEATTPTGSSASALTFLASPGKPETPMGSTSSGGFMFLPSPKQPTAPGGGFPFLASPKRSPAAIAGPTANGGFAFSVAPEQPLTPTGSSAVATTMPSPTPASTDSTSSSGFAFFPSPGPVFGNASSPGGAAPSPPFVFSAWPARKYGGGRGGSNRRTRRNVRVATPRRGSTRPRDEKPTVVTSPPQKVAKTAAGDPSRSSILSGPCCSFFTSPAKSAKQESKNSSSEASRCSSSYKPAAGVTSPVRPSSSVEKTTTPEGEVEVSSAERKAPRPSSPAAACTGAEVVVRVTCKCGVHKEFSFDHSH